MATTAISSAEFDSPDAAEEKAKLQKHFGRADIFFFLVCTLVGVDGLGTLATQGGAGFTWLIVSVILFAIPSALILSELGAAYTEEGGPYVWVRLAFGHLAGAVNNFFYWVTNPVWMGGTLVGTAIGGLIVFMNNDNSWDKTPTIIFGVVFIWLGVLFAILSFKVGKWVATDRRDCPVRPARVLHDHRDRLRRSSTASTVRRSPPTSSPRTRASSCWCR